MILVLLRWWYTTGWLQVVHSIGAGVSRIEHTLSVPILLRTIFAPWRRIVSVGGRTIDQKIRAALDNIVSRCIGGVIRLAVLCCAALGMLGCLAFGLVAILIWPLLPPAAIFFAARSIIG